MTVNSNVSASGDLTISIDGRFDFHCQDDFKSIYQAFNDDEKKSKKINVDMKGTEYIDSSALGMLLMMREHFGGTSAEIALLNCSGDIKEAMNTAKFEMLFKIS